MSQLVAEVPEVVVKPGKMLNYWMSKLKVGALLIIFVLYVYFLLFIKTYYLKSKRLNRIMNMAAETEKMMHKIHNIDEDLALKINQIEEFYGDY